MNMKIEERQLDADLLELFRKARPLTSTEERRLAKAGEALDDDPAFRADYLKGLFVERILEAMADEGLSQSAIARQWGKSRQHLSRLLSEDRRVNFTLETMTELASLAKRKLDLVVLNPHEHTHVLRCHVPNRAISGSDAFERPAPRRPANVCDADFSDQKPFRGSLDDADRLFA